MMELSKDNRPVLQLPYSQLEWVLEAISLLALLALVGLTAWYWPHLPARIPMHFNISGQVDNWSDKDSFLLLAVMSAVMYLLLTIASRFPRAYNYAVTITVENYAAQYRLAREVVSELKCVLMGIFLYLQWTVARVALGAQSILDSRVMFTLMGVMFAILAIYITRSVRAR